MKKEEIAKELLKSADSIGLLITLSNAFGRNISVRIQFSKDLCDVGIDELDFSARANNSLKRAGVFTVREVIELIENGRLLQIRNLGKKTLNEIKTRILVLGYDGLTAEEKKKFFIDTVERNT